MRSEENIEDSEFGVIRIRRNARAIRFIFRYVEREWICTSPLLADVSEVRVALEKLRPRLRAMKERVKCGMEQRMMNASTRIESEDFCFRMEEAPVRSLQMCQRRGMLVCRYPKGQNWSESKVQNWLVSQVEESLRTHARVLFPPRLKELADARGLKYTSLSIHRTRGRWGSCSSRGRINLSLYLVLLPHRLQDYVMQHELTHLVEMNHGARFWQLLDGVTEGHALALRQELKRYDTSVLSALANVRNYNGCDAEG